MVDVFDRHGVRFDPRLAGCSRFVRYSDYAALEAQLAEAERRKQELEREVTGLRNSYFEERKARIALEATPPAPKVTEGHPMQPVVVDEGGVHRFKSNKCVEALLDHGQETGFGLNELARQEHTTEDRMQLAQLIGYSVSGYGDLSYVSDASYDNAAKQSQALTAAQESGQ